MRIAYLLILTVLLCSAQTSNDKDSVKLVKQLPNNLSELRSELDDTFSDPNFNNAFWGVAIQSLKSGETIYKLNADKLFRPASLQKLFTTSTALLLLGPNYKFTTSFYTDGNISEGVLKGNLYIVGNGDPKISSGHAGAERDQLIEFCDSLNQLGIYSIKGNVIADDKKFKEDSFGEGWLNEYENNWFAPPSGAFCLNNNSTEVIVKPAELKQLAGITLNPSVNDFEIYNKVITETASSVININVIKKGNNVLQLNGSIPLNTDPYVIYVPVQNPSQFFVNAFYETLLMEGITVTGYATLIDEQTGNFDPDNLLFLFENKSNKLSNVVTDINKNSNNLYAEQLLKTIGFELYGYGSTENGIAAMKDLLQKMGINPSNFESVDGSGLSNFDLVTPKQIINLLTYMYRSDAFNEFYQSLAIAGFDGTLSDRMKKSKAENNFRGKSGYLQNVRGLAGYLKSADGEPLAVALIVNNFLVPSQLANYVLDKVCNRLANFTRN